MNEKGAKSADSNRNDNDREDRNTIETNETIESDKIARCNERRDSAKEEYDKQEVRIPYKKFLLGLDKLEVTIKSKGTIFDKSSLNLQNVKEVEHHGT